MGSNNREIPKIETVAERFLVHQEDIPPNEIREESEKEEKGAEKKTFGMSYFAGTFTTDRGLNNWRILGMAHRRPEKECGSHDLDVIRLPGQWTLADGTVVKETLTKSKMEYILRLCGSDDPDVHRKFWEEVETVKELRFLNRFNKRQADCFPRFLASDKLSKGVYVNEGKKYQRTFTIPRPFYIMERIEPNLETIMNSGLKKGIGSYASVFLTMGILNALRYLHNSGYVHRDVQPSAFGVRLGPHGKLCRSESELSYSVAFVSLSMCRKRDRRQSEAPPCVLMYSSPSAMKGLEQTPVDDCISAMYIFYNMVTTKRLPWCDTVKMDKPQMAVLKAKLDFEKKTNDLTNAANAPVFNGMQEIFKEIRKSNGFNTPLDYDAVIALLRRGLGRIQEDIKDVTIFGFQQPVMMAFRHGIEYKDATKTTTVVEREDIVSRIDHLFPNTVQKESDEKEKSKPAK